MAESHSLPTRAEHATKRGSPLRNKQQSAFIAVTLVPMVLVFGIFWIYPLFSGLWGSMTQWQGFDTARPFIGVRHYATLISDPVFRTAVANTFLYALIDIPTTMVLALSVALAIEGLGNGRLRGLFRTLYFLPVVTSVIATALIWKWLYQPSFGLFNQLLELAGLPGQRFLQSRTQALPSIAVYGIWKNMGFSMVLFLAGLNAIDRSFYEAARVDGAGWRQSFRFITLPLLQPTLIFVLITGIINSLQVFDPIFVMSGVSANDPPGGPLNATTVVSVYQWQTAFRQLNLGYGSAMGIALFAIILAVTLLQGRLLRSRWEL